MTSYAASSAQQSGRPYLGPRSVTTKEAVPQLKAPIHMRSFSAASPAPNSVPLLPTTANGSTGNMSSAHDDDEGTETLLWAFAQFSGSFTVEEALVKNGEYVAVKRSLVGGGKGGSNSRGTGGEGAIGGGSLGTENLNANSSVSKGGWTNWLWGGASGSSDPQDHQRSSGGNSGASGAVADPVVDGRNVRRASAATVVPQLASITPAIGSLEERRKRMMNDASIPVFSSPPSILAVDLVLEPGESKTCKPS